MANIAGSASSVYDSYLEKQLLAAAYSLISFTGVLGNSIVLLAVLFSRKPRTTTNVFVVNLAVADLITCLSLPIMVLAVLSENGEKLLVSHHLCALQGFLLIVCLGCSLNNIASLAVCRALITRRGNQLRPTSFFTGRKLAAIVATNWIIPVAVGILPIVSEFGSYEYDAKLSTCSFNPTANGSSTFSKILVFVNYPVQLLVIITSYTFIFFKVRKYNRTINGDRQPTVAAVGGAMRLPSQSESSKHSHTSVHGAMPASNQLPMPTHHGILRGRPRRSLAANRPSSRTIGRQLAQCRPSFRRNIDITLSLFLVVFFFLVCLTPYCVAVFFVKNRSHKIVPFLAMLFVSNSCINPVIYTARHPDFKRVCRCIMLCRLSRIPMKSSFLGRLLNLRRG